MKSRLLFFLFLPLSLALSAQNQLTLHLSQRLGSAPFALNTTATGPSAAQFKVTRLQYYVSEIEIVHDNGQVTPATDVYLLVNPATDSTYALGSFPGVQNIEGIQFSIGVDQAHNHLDPASYPADHALAPKNPSMHWGWASGYRFAALEGKAGTNFTQTFEVHTVGNNNYKTVQIDVAGETTPEGQTIHLIADYANIVKNINVANGPIVHGSTGAAVTLVTNLQNEVFSPALVSGVVDPAFTGAFALAPNPAAAGAAAAVFTLPAGADYQLTATDLAGRSVARQQLNAGAQRQALPALAPGFYLVHLWANGKAVAVEKLVVE